MELPSSKRRLAGIATAAEIPLLVAITPFLLFPSPSRVLVLAAVVVLFAARWYAGDRLIPPSALNPPLLLLLLMVGVSMFVTVDLRFSLGKIAGMVLGALTFWAIVRWLNSAGRLRFAVILFSSCALGLSALGLFGAPVRDAKFEFLTGLINRLPKVVKGVPGAESGFNPNPVAGCLLLFLPLLLVLLRGPIREWVLEGRSLAVRRAFTAAVLLTLAATTATVLLMQSRGAWAGLVLAGACFLMWYGARTRRAVAAAGAGLLLVAVILGPENMMRRATMQAGAGLATGITVRSDLWARAIRGIRDYPLTGMGMNGFRKIMPVRYPLLIRSAGIYSDADPVHAHNHLLQAALDLGLPGLAAYLWLWIASGVLLVRVYRHAGSHVYRTLAGALGAGLIAHFAFGITDVIPLGAKVGILFWFTLALVAGLHQVAMMGRPSPQGQRETAAPA